MTNAQIIFSNQLALMEAGIIRGTGRFVEATTINEEGEEVTAKFEEPEEIHTFNAWKSLGRKIKKGEHAIAKFPIWKYSTRQVGTATNTETGEEEPVEDSRCFMKMSHFFTIAQTEPIEA